MRNIDLALWEEYRLTVFEENVRTYDRRSDKGINIIF
jgi:hypothetical protein